LAAEAGEGAPLTPPVRPLGTAGVEDEVGLSGGIPRLIPLWFELLIRDDFIFFF